jgi:hypothetical protein
MATNRRQEITSLSSDEQAAFFREGKKASPGDDRRGTASPQFVAMNYFEPLTAPST